MKSSLLVSLLVLCSMAQADVASVRRKVTAINAMRLSPRTVDRTDLSAEGAQITVWRDAKGTPRKIVTHIYGETGREHDTLYLEKGLPLFLFAVKEKYDGPLTPSVKVAQRREMRLYFEKGKLFQRRDDQKVTALTPTFARSAEARYKSFSSLSGAHRSSASRKASNSPRDISTPALRARPQP